ncbi:RepB family plasmid replication initiator protein [Clostridium frigidicarnis]|uniref:Initiator Replication protein n=1 Tax=Clostridium frigidicarnis TaxID=84698 RepID=A0A1I0ZH79_9CLOT|nr:RepB family plasmid replication initiator protein [Clostridium frigidicarnis]SFB25014.1 Initiator Replication protein [Clostridium frigidicarnis]
MNKKIIRRKSNSSNIFTPEFKSIYGKLLFFHLKPHINESEYCISLETLKNVLLAPTLSYVYSNLKIKVLDRIIQEFSSINSPILFTYEVIEENNTCLIKFIFI